MYQYKKLRGRIVERYGSQKAFSAALGISENSVSRKLTCETGFSQEDITIWANLLGISKSEYPEYFFA